MTTTQPAPATGETGEQESMPCNFCGGTDIDTKFDELRFLKPYCWVVVCKCGANGPNRSSEHAALVAWNAGTNHALLREREALATALTNLVNHAGWQRVLELQQQGFNGLLRDAYAQGLMPKEFVEARRALGLPEIDVTETSNERT